MSNATSSQGCQLRRGDGGSPEVFTLIGEILSFNGPSETAPQIDVTSLDSQAREYISGLRDGGSIDIEFNFVASDTMQQGLRADMANRTLRNFELALNDDIAPLTIPTTISFTAVVTEFSIKGSVDEQVSASAGLKISGVPTWVLAS